MDLICTAQITYDISTKKNKPENNKNKKFQDNVSNKGNEIQILNLNIENKKLISKQTRSLKRTTKNIKSKTIMNL